MLLKAMIILYHGTLKHTHLNRNLEHKYPRITLTHMQLELDTENQFRL